VVHGAPRHRSPASAPPPRRRARPPRTGPRAGPRSWGGLSTTRRPARPPGRPPVPRRRAAGRRAGWHRVRHVTEPDRLRIAQPAPYRTGDQGGLADGPPLGRVPGDDAAVGRTATTAGATTDWSPSGTIATPTGGRPQPPRNVVPRSTPRLYVMSPSSGADARPSRRSRLSVPRVAPRGEGEDTSEGEGGPPAGVGLSRPGVPDGRFRGRGVGSGGHPGAGWRRRRVARTVRRWTCGSSLPTGSRGTRRTSSKPCSTGRGWCGSTSSTGTRTPRGLTRQAPGPARPRRARVRGAQPVAKVHTYPRPGLRRAARPRARAWRARALRRARTRWSGPTGYSPCTADETWPSSSTPPTSRPSTVARRLAKGTLRPTRPASCRARWSTCSPTGCATTSSSLTQQAWTLERQVTGGHVGDTEQVPRGAVRGPARPARRGDHGRDEPRGVRADVPGRSSDAAGAPGSSTSRTSSAGSPRWPTGSASYLQGVIEFYQTRTGTKMTIARSGWP
jgi:hypothetical protein